MSSAFNSGTSSSPSSSSSSGSSSSSSPSSSSSSASSSSSSGSSEASSGFLAGAGAGAGAAVGLDTSVLGATTAGALGVDDALNEGNENVVAAGADPAADAPAVLGAKVEVVAGVDPLLNEGNEKEVLAGAVAASVLGANEKEALGAATAAVSALGAKEKDVLGAAASVLGAKENEVGAAAPASVFGANADEKEAAENPVDAGASDLGAGAGANEKDVVGAVAAMSGLGITKPGTVAGLETAGTAMGLAGLEIISIIDEKLLDRTTKALRVRILGVLLGDPVRGFWTPAPTAICGTAAFGGEPCLTSTLLNWIISILHSKLQVLFVY